jgi:hypothetical protein
LASLYMKASSEGISLVAKGRRAKQTSANR